MGNPEATLLPLDATAIAIILLVMSFNFVGDGVRDAFDPRLRNIR